LNEYTDFSISNKLIVEQYLEELSLNLAPLGLERVLYIKDTNISVYSNDRIKNYLLELIKDDPDLSNVYNIIKNDIISNNIVIGYTTSGLIPHTIYKSFESISSIIKKILNSVSSLFGIYITSGAFVFGFYHSQTNKIALILDHNAPKLGFSGEFIDDIKNVLIHEMCHRMAATKNKKFIGKFFDIIYKFYDTFLNCIKEKYNHIYKNNQLQFNKNYEKSLKILILKLLETEKIHNNTDDLINDIWSEFLESVIINPDKIGWEKIGKMFFININVYGNNEKIIPETEILMNNSNTCFYNSYKNIGIIDIDNYAFFQELLYPSEIIAILSKNGDNKIRTRILNNLE